MKRALPMLLVVALAGCPPEPEGPGPLPYADPGERGPFGVGATTIVWVDARDKVLTAEVWYPAQVEPGAPGDDYGDLSRAGYAHRDASADLRWGPYPLVAFSHGFGGIRYQSTFLTEHLASHGFVVVSPDHPRNTLFDLDQDLAAVVAAERPGDVRSSVDRVLEASTNRWFGLGGLVDPAAGYGMSGHSFGAWTTLAVAGGVLDPEFLAEHCAANDEAGCDFVQDLGEVLEVTVPAPDPRVRASVPMAPGLWYAFGETGLEGVVHPLVLGGDLDADLPYDREIRPVFDRLGADRALLTVQGAGHWGFSDLCETVNLEIFSDCEGEAGGYVDPAVTWAVVQEATTAHFQVHLRGEERASASLGPARWTGVQATWEE